MRTMQAADEQQRMMFPPIPVAIGKEYATSREFGFEDEKQVGTTMSYQANTWERKLLNLNMTHQSRF